MSIRRGKAIKKFSRSGKRKSIQTNVSPVAPPQLVQPQITKPKKKVPVLGITISAIVLGGLYAMWSFKQKVSDMFGGTIDFFTGAIDDVGNFFTGAVDDVGDFGKDAFSFLGDIADDVTNAESTAVSFLGGLIDDAKTSDKSASDFFSDITLPKLW